MKKLLSIKTERLHDEDPDTSFLGTYLNEPCFIGFCFDRQNGNLAFDGNIVAEMPVSYWRGECRYVGKFQHSGNNEENCKYILQDVQRLEDLNNAKWSFIGICAIAEVRMESGIVQRIHSGGLWGIESDSNEEYLKSIESEQLEELKNELRSLGLPTEVEKD